MYGSLAGYIWKKILTKSDFSGIKVGDTIDDAIEVDHAATIRRQKMTWNTYGHT